MKKYNGLISMIHPTQATVGYAEVAVKMAELSKYDKDGTLVKYINSKPIPCVLGPDGIAYITDHHHMGMALSVLGNEWIKENAKKNQDENPFIHCTFNILYNFSKSGLSKKDFFRVLNSLNFLHPYDENGIETEIIPKRLVDLKNDPYRSLAGFVRKSGGFNKVDTHYVEFVWADFFRKCITIDEINKNIKKAVIKGINIALSDAAQELPGWKGVDVLNNLKDEYMDKIKINHKVINKASPNIEQVVQSAKETQPNPIKFNKK